MVLDNFSTHSTAAVKEWLAEHPNFHFHFTPVSGSFMNQVETWFGVITKQAIRRGTFKSVAHLIRRINDYIANWNSALDAGLARQPGDPLAVDQQA